MRDRFQPRRGSPNRKQLNAANLMRHLGGRVHNWHPASYHCGFYYPAGIPGGHDLTLSGPRGSVWPWLESVDINGSWRWPVLSLEQINTAREPELFLEHSISRFCAAVEKCGVSSQGLAEAMKLQRCKDNRTKTPAVGTSGT